MFDGYIRDHAFWTPDAPAVVTPEGSAAYAQLDADVDRVGAGLIALGLGEASGVVSLRIAHAYMHRVVLLALARIGCASSPAEDPAADIRLVMTPTPPDEDTPNTLRLTREWAQAVFAAPHRPLPRLDPDPDRLVRVMLSSGTTQTPRRIGFTWQRLETATLTNIRVYGAGRIGTWVPLTGVDSLLGFSMGVACWALGGAYASGLGVDALPGLMARDPQGVAVMTPILLRGLLAALPADFEPRPGWRLQVGGSSLPPALAEEAGRRITPDIWIGYGATESSRITAAPAAAFADLPSGVGIVPASALVEIVDEAGQPLPDGETGELRVRSTRTADGYLGDPEATAQRFRDGWYYTNDLGRRLPDGRLVLDGRVDDRMNLGGRKLMPRVWEEPALECPGIREVCAFAVPDADGLDVVWLAIVADPGFDHDELERHLAKYPGLPRNRFAWFETLPRNAMGKIERNKLRDAVLRVTRGS